MNRIPRISILTMAGLLGAQLAAAQGPGCYTLESLQGSFGVVNLYGPNLALGIQAETLDGKGGLTRTGILNQPVVGSVTGERTVGTVTSNGTYTVNCDGTGTITRIVTRPDGTTAPANDDLLITEAIEQDGKLIATRFLDVQQDVSVILPGGVFLTRTHTRRPNAGCYTLESLQGSYGVANTYGNQVAMGIQAETFDGLGNLMRTGVLNQPVAGSPTGARTVGIVTSRGTYSVNCNGTGTITRVVTRPDGTTASASDDLLITEGVEQDGKLIATAVVDVQRDPSVILPGGVFLIRTHTRRPRASASLEARLQGLACSAKAPSPSCQVSISVWNYYLTQLIPGTVGLVIGDSSALMTVQQYMDSRGVAGLP